MDDMISRQAAIDEAKEWIDAVYFEENDKRERKAIECFIGSLKNIPSVQQWTPCSERLPEEEGWYLVTIQNDKTRKRRTENDLFAIGIAEAHKHTPYKFCKDGHRQTVIAWMPIPEPYKAESEEV